MGKVLSIILGALAVVIGVILLIRWWGWFLHGVQAVMPSMLILGGLIALVAGVSEIKDALKEKKEAEKK